MRISSERRFAWPRIAAVAALGIGIAAVPVSPTASAQAPASGQNVVPVYEGYWPQEDGSYDLVSNSVVQGPNVFTFKPTCREPV